MEYFKDIEKENWKKAIGVKYKKGETNAALAERDYSHSCALTKKIVVIKGYHLWWCSSHHQPFYKCELDQMKLKLNAIEEIINAKNPM